MSYKRQRLAFDPDFIRLKDAMKIFSIGPEKVEQLARECGAYYKVDKLVLIKTDVMREYVNSFKVE